MATLEQVILGRFQRMIHIAEAQAQRALARRSPLEPREKIEEHLAEEQHRLAKEKETLETALGEEEKQEKRRRAELQRQIERLSRQIEDVEKRRAENRGFVPCLRY